MEYTEGRSPNYSDMALGLVSTRSFPAIVGTADMMVKAASVTLIGYEQIGGGYCTAVVRGSLSDVRIAVEVGAETAEQFGQLISQVVIPRPMPNLEAVLPIGSRLAQMLDQRGYSRLSNQAIGLIETKGFPAMVGAADAMLKSADVQLAGYETIGAGLCTAIIRGRVSDVTMAIEAGMHEAERIGELNAVMVIPRPLEDLERSLPTASCWLDQPLALPIELKTEQKELVEVQQLEAATQEQAMELPDLSQIELPEPLELKPLQNEPEPLELKLPQPESEPLELKPLQNEPEPLELKLPQPESEPLELKSLQNEPEPLELKLPQDESEHSTPPE